LWANASNSQADGLESFKEVVVRLAFSGLAAWAFRLVNTLGALILWLFAPSLFLNCFFFNRYDGSVCWTTLRAADCALVFGVFGSPPDTEGQDLVAGVFVSALAIV